MLETRRADVQGAAAVVFAESRRSVDLENVTNGLASRELACEEFPLVVVAAVRGDELQHHAILCGPGLHVLPGHPGTGLETRGAPEHIETRVHQGVAFGLRGHRSEEHTSELQSRE